MPREGRKGGEGDPFSRTEKLGEVMRFMIHLVQVALKPKANKHFVNIIPTKLIKGFREV
jgi:hypothetical protein